MNELPQVAFVVVLKTAMAFVPQVSVAVGASNVHALPHWTVLPWTHVMVGAVVSITVTGWLHVAWLPQVSIARQVRVAVNVLPQPALVTVVAVTVTLVSAVS